MPADGLHAPVELGEPAVTDLGHPRQVPLALGLVGLRAELLLPFLDFPDSLDQALFTLPVHLHGLQARGQVGHVRLQALQALPGGRIGFLLEGLALDLRLGDASLDLVDLRGHAVDLDAQLGGALVDEVDGLVRQEPVGDIPVGEGGRRHDGRVLDAHPVVHFVFFLEPAQDGDGVLHRGLHHQDGLEAALQGRIFLDVLAVFIDGRGPHAPQGPAGQGRLEHVGGVHGPFGRPGAHEGMQLVDEQDHLPFGPLDLLQHRLEPVLEFAAVFGPGDQGAHVEGQQSPVFQDLGDIALHDAPGQALHNGGLAHPRLADEHGIVLGAPGEHLHDASDLLVPADDRVQLPQARQGREIPAEAFQGLVLLLRIGVRDALLAADFLEHPQERVPGDPLAGEQRGRFPPLFAEGQQQVFHADVLVAHLGSFVEAGFQNRLEFGRDEGLEGSADLGQALHGLRRIAAQGFQGHAQLAQDGTGHPVLLLQHGRQKVQGFNLLVAVARCQTLGTLNQFLGLDGELVETHVASAN